LPASEQRERISAYVRQCGWELARVLEDGPGTGGRPPQLEALLGDLQEVDKFIVTSGDRVGGARRVHDVIGLLDSNGVDFVCIEHDLDTGSAGGDVVRRMLALLAGWDPARLRDKGLSPRTVIDVGVAAGTPELYEAFPGAYQVLIEPLHEFERGLRRILAEYDGEYHLTAVGASEGRASLRLDASLAMSSLLEPAEPRPGSRREVPIATLDALFRERRWAGPFGLKIDVEGYEHRVVEGAAELLRETEFVIAETSVTTRFEEGVRCDELIALMRRHGFAVADVLAAGSGRLGTQADLLFVRLDA